MAFKELDPATSKKVVEMLEHEYPDVHYYLNFKTPVDLVAAAILSAQTRDEVTNSVTPDLFKRFKTAKDYANSNEEELFEYIGRVTFGGMKAKNILKTFKVIDQRYNGQVPKTMVELLELPGIGRKTANTILINAYGIVEGIPVDTWVIKLSARIGLSASKDPEDIEQDLMKTVEKKYWKNITYVFKTHGKKICQSQVPVCSACLLNKLCPKNSVTKSK